MVAGVDRKNQFVSTMTAPGIFELCHSFLEIQNCLINFYEYPDEMHDLIKYLCDWEMRVAEDVVAHIHPEMVFHHDDWGSQQSTFLAPSMFEDFFLETYKTIYGYYHDHGVQYVVQHCDSYCATLVDDMIEMGIDVWQGGMSSNDIPSLVEKYKGKIAFMTGFDNAWVDNADWNEETIHEVVFRELDKYSQNSFIPCLTGGGAETSYAPIYDLVGAEVSKYNEQRFGCSSFYKPTMVKE